MIVNKISKLLLLPLALALLLPTAVSAATDVGAASPKTSADFKDLANLDAGLKAKIDALLAKGVFDGVSDNSFGIDQDMTRAQMTKVLALIYGVNIDGSVKTSSFSDVKADDAANGWAIPYIEAAKKAGMIDGVADGVFDPGDNATLGQLATAMLKGLGKKVDVSGTPWYKDAIQQAVDLKLLPQGSDGSADMTRKDLIPTAFQADQVVQQLLEELKPTPTPTPTSTPSSTGSSGNNSGSGTSTPTSTPPTVESQTYSSTSTSGAHVSIQTANASKLYYVLVSGASQTPSAADVKSLQVHSGTQVDCGSATVAAATYEHDFTGLSSGVSYTLYSVAENAQGDLSVVKSLAFQTAPPPSVSSVTYSTYISDIYARISLNIGLKLPDSTVSSVVYETYGCSPYSATADQIVLGTGSPSDAIQGHSSVTVTNGTTALITVDGLFPSTTYYFYFVVEQNGVRSVASSMYTIVIPSSGP